MSSEGLLNADPPKRVKFRFLSGFGAILFSVSVDFGEILRLCGIFRLRVVESADLGFLPKITWWCIGKIDKARMTWKSTDTDAG